MRRLVLAEDEHGRYDVIVHEGSRRSILVQDVTLTVAKSWADVLRRYNGFE